jgi:hypothetical protein
MSWVHRPAGPFPRERPRRDAVGPATSAYGHSILKVMGPQVDFPIFRFNYYRNPDPVL